MSGAMPTAGEAARAPSTPDPLEYFRSELERATTSNERRDVVKNLGTVAKLITPAQIDADLMPILDGLSRRECEDEMVHTLLIELRVVASRCSQDSVAFKQILQIAENLCGHDEAAVREAAVETIDVIERFVVSRSRRSEFVVFIALPILERCLQSPRFVTRMSGTMLLPKLYPSLPRENATAMSEIFVSLTRDEAPSVRRAAANALVLLCKVASSNDLLQVFHRAILNFINDSMDEQLRVGAVTALGCLSRRISSSRIETFVLHHLQKATKDRSWRVRLALVRIVPELLACHLPEPSQVDTVTSWLESLCTDTEPEVASSTIDALRECLVDIPAEVLLKRIVPLISTILADSAEVILKTSDKDGDGTASVQSLVDDPVGGSVDGLLRGAIPKFSVAEQEAGLAIANRVAALLGPLSVRLGPEPTRSQVIPLCLLLLQSHNREVRYRAVEQFAFLTDALGDGRQAKELFVKLVRSALSDPQWRIRSGVVQQLGRLIASSALGSPAEWEPFFYRGLLDPAQAIRTTTIAGIPGLVKIIGKQWLHDRLLPQILCLYQRTLPLSDSGSSGAYESVGPMPFDGAVSEAPRSVRSYLTRVTVMQALQTIAMCCDSPDVVAKITDHLAQALEDPIANIRLMSLRFLLELVKSGCVPPAFTKQNLSEILNRCLYDKDPDVQRTAKFWLDATRPEFTAVA